MTWLRRVRPALYVLGVLLVVGTLVGARAMTNAHGAAEGQQTAHPAPGNEKAGGPIVMGTVDSDPPPADYRLPPVLQSGTVAEVFVKDGQPVKKGDKLYEFDTSIQRHDVERANVAVLQAKNEVAKAVEGKKQHGKKVAVAEQAVEAAKMHESAAATRYRITKHNIEEALRRADEKLTQEQIDAKLANNPDLFKANADWIDAKNVRERLQAELELLKASAVDLLVTQAEIAEKQAMAEHDKAQTAVNLCTVTAKTDGTVEQVKISPGATLGIGTRDPALWIIPAGPRIVRAEIEAEFAHRVGPDLKGKEVTIMDHTNPKLTYAGRVLRVSDTFLPKRTEGLLPNETRVLEALVEVTDPAPAGKPPLRVGQRVRVNLGQ
jgi:multidrug resistance efflux pump